MKYKYLYRLVAIIILAPIVPVILFLKFFWFGSSGDERSSRQVAGWCMGKAYYDD